ncbi:translocation protein SEC63 homolog isoform X2 [Pecten maximus]|uniref:translocation protein SEC63 homolog isoform X2 n=1 Tax=Pecten maximus TaxID=6579 RepID=UPI001458BAA8|nr:translocation protein SEC63 homolog isoform X2 [Pecten maximus]
MAGMQFEYDEEGGTFFYFLLSFWSLWLVPTTAYYFWPSDKKTEPEKDKRKGCNCEPCQLKKYRLKANSKWDRTRDRAVKFGLIISWVILIALAYKVSKIQMDYVEYDPYLELGIDRGASDKEIKKAYRAMSLKYHPDKETGDPKKFMKIAKAYAALTDEDTKENWEKHGNPDGPGVVRFGIALPKWIVERENSMLVLAAYGLIFMIILPVVVGIWWYRSIKFSKDQVLLDTTRLYYFFFQKAPNMMLKRCIMVLGASFEFDKFHNKEVIERPSDNEEVPQLIKRLPHLDEKNKEKPLCFPYSVKARALLHAHFTRLDLQSSTLEQDKQFVIGKCPCLINEMINITAQLVAGAARNAVAHMPRLETVENCMKASQMLIQGLNERSSPLLQLPHIGQDMLKHFNTKKRHIQRITDLIAMKEEDRRLLFRNLGNEEYRDIINVCASMPYVTMEVRSEVLDDEDSTITAGSIVTVTVELHRENMEVLFEKDNIEFSHMDQEAIEENTKTEDMELEPADSLKNQQQTQQPQKTAAKKQQKNKKVVKKKKAPKQAYNWKAAAAEKESNKQNSLAVATIGGAETEAHKKEEENDNSDAETDEGGNDSEEENTKMVERANDQDKNAAVVEEDDEEQWKKYQEEAKMETTLDTKVKESHPVHCPYFSDDRQEGWWLYVGDKKSHMLITAPVQIQTLKTKEEIQLKFSAPVKPGVYTYFVILRSDSYLDFDQQQKIRLDVKEAKLVKDHPQWDISDDEEDKDKDDDSDSDYSTDMSDSE